MSTMIHEFAAVTASLPGNNTVVTFHYIGAMQQSSVLLGKSTPKAVSAHHSTPTTNHVPVSITSAAASTGDAGNTAMAPGVSFNPTLFFLGLFLMVVAITMVWYILRRARQNKVDLNKFVS